MNIIVNPLAGFDTPDPFMTYDAETGYYYALFTRHDRLEIFRSWHAADIIRGGESKTIYVPNGEKDGVWGMIWAPEMHRGTNGKWYIYTSGLYDPEKWPKRLFIVESETSDPFGDWHFKCKPAPDMYAIDPTVYTHTDGRQYICYSFVDGDLQTLEIRELENPWTFGEKKAVIARAEYDWELTEPYVGDKAINEGPFFIRNGDRLFIVYSANGAFNAFYCLGVLEYTGGDLVSASSWQKHDRPLLAYGNGVYAPGHASFFRSPDGTELWCAYHAVKEYTETLVETERYMRLQRVEFDGNGYPVMGVPVPDGEELAPPSGEEEQTESRYKSGLPDII
ncbi:MAG: glycoside hydrolase family 43 protein [Clostridia bacterium]|nr:glycoside hydrolase family 43 protein [Clostridia bacterium]